MINPLKLKIRAKLALVLIIVLFITIGVSSLLWYSTVRTVLRKEISISQKQLGTRATEKVDNFLDAKIRALIIHSQSAAFLVNDDELQKLDLSIFLTQDQDIKELTYIDSTGKEKIKLNRETATFSDENELLDRSESPSFLANTSRYTKEFIGEVEFSQTGIPFIYISIPIKTPLGSQRLTELQTQNSAFLVGSNELVHGVIEAQIVLENLFQEITDLGTDSSTSLFLVDKAGRIIAHRNSLLIGPNSVEENYPPVKQYVNDSQNPIANIVQSGTMEYQSKENVKTLGSYSPIAQTGWALIAEQEASIAYADLTTVLTFAIVMLIAGIVFSVIIAFILSKKITNPIRVLKKGADKISDGHLDHVIKINSQDELQDLAETFNNMTAKLKNSIHDLRNDKAVIASEKNKLEIVISGIEDAVIVINKDMEIVVANKAAERLLGLDSDKIINKNLTSIFTLFDKDKEIAFETYSINKTITEGILFENKTLMLKTSKDVEKYVSLIAGKVKTNTQSNINVIFTIHDITPEHALEEMKLDFVSMAAHELRTPLTSIVGFTSMLMDETKDVLSKKHLSVLERMYASGKRLNNLIDNLLNVSRIEKNEFKLQFGPIELSKIANSTVDELQQLALAKKQTLKFISPKIENVYIFGDKFKIVEVFTNLIVNAINYTQESGEITVSIDENSKSYITTISDNGKGISKESQTHLFKKFYRVPHGLEQQASGTGLGLYITKSIISLHKGKIRVESELGKGSKFIFEIPKIGPKESETTNSNPSGINRSGIIRKTKSMYN